MEYRRLGRSGLKVSTIGLGSWLTFGRRVSEEGVRACVAAAVDAGILLFDTADIYDLGEAEKVVGRALASYPRNEYVLATKLFWPMSENPNDRGLSRKHVMEACDASLKRLGVDYIDLYQCHRYDPETPVDEVVLAMDDLARRGKILYWGVSVWSGEQIRHALAESDRYLAHRPVSNQPPYSLLNRGIEAEVLPVSRAEGLGQLVFSPLAQGLLTGKYAQGRIPEGSRAADENRNRFLKPLMTDENLEKARRLAELARGMDVTPAQLALAWCLRDPIVSGAIIGATEPGQVRENAKAAELKVPGDVLAQLDEIFPGSDPPDQP